MAYAIISENGKTSYGVYSFVIDTTDDLTSLPVNKGMGSTAFCIDNSKTYMLNSSGEWKEVTLN